MKILTLFFTYGTSLENWYNNGSIDRELSVYKKFLKYFDKIYFITYGRKDLIFTNNFPKNIIVLPKKININNSLYSILIPFLYKKEIKESTWLKTNQMMGSWSAVLSKIFFGKKLNIRTGYTESLSYLNKNFLKKNITKIVEFLSYKLSDVSIVTSQHQKDYIKEKYSPRNINIIPNGIDTEVFKPEKNKVSSDKTELLFIGRLHSEKNILNLLEAIKYLKNIKFKIIGQGPLKKDILKFKEKYNLNLEMLSSIPNNKLPAIYNAANIYIQPSLYEGNPKTIIEAMSCGLPVIATDINGINNVITHEKTGFLCKIASESIKSAILELVGDRELRESLGKNAREFIEKKYDLNKLIASEIKIYESHH